MKLITKRIKIISMTHEEHAMFLACMERAKEGHTSHYAESKLADGSFLDVSIVSDEQVENERRAEQELKNENCYKRKFSDNRH